MKAHHATILLTFWIGASIPAQQAKPDDTLLAWYRFEEGRERYKGKPYLWLGDADMRLVIDVKPRPGHVLELLWGAKNDRREAQLAVNGKLQRLSHGGHDGFEWLRVQMYSPSKGHLSMMCLNTLMMYWRASGYA